MCGSSLSVKGGMVSVAQNYLQYEKWDRIKIKYIPTHIEKNKVLVALYFLFAYIKVVIIATIGSYDIIYLHTAERGSFYRKSIIVKTMRFLNKKTIMHHHAAEFEYFYESLSARQKKYVNDTLTQTSLNIVLSNNLVSMIKSKAPKANVKVLYNAVKTYSTIQYNQNANGILFLGRLGKRKGIFDLIQAITELDSVLSSRIVFYFCGDGNIDEIIQNIKSAGISHRIAKIGWINQKEKEAIFKDTIINVLPSYNEGLPMSILETMAYGIPNISTNIASIPEVIHNEENGFLITPGDINALADCMLTLVKNENLRNMFSAKSWAEIKQRFSMEEHANKLQNYIEELVSK